MPSSSGAGSATSRAVAVEAVDAGRVSVGGAPATSPARQVGADEPITVAAPAAPVCVHAAA